MPPYAHAQDSLRRNGVDSIFTPDFFRPYEESARAALSMLCSARAQMSADVSAMTFRLKSPASIRGKLLRKGLPLTTQAASAALSDIAGLRVVLSNTQAVYRFARLLCQSEAVQLVRVHDYIASPKRSGYRSLHLIMRPYSGPEHQAAPVEIQLRTPCMDVWASIEHRMIYKPLP